MKFHWELPTVNQRDKVVLVVSLGTGAKFAVERGTKGYRLLVQQKEAGWYSVVSKSTEAQTVEELEDWIQDYLRPRVLGYDPVSGVQKHAEVQHLKRGSVYATLGTGTLQASEELPEEGDSLVIYIDTERKIWLRKEKEFWDGRFKTLSQL